jgi:Ca2+-transporting ATPase
VGAVRIGRRIYDNLQKAMAYILAVHVPIAGMSLLPVLVPGLAGHSLPLVLMPVHIAFLELIIDPACSVVFEAEPEEQGIMDVPPRRPDEPLFSRRMLTVSLLQGVVVLAAVVIVYLWSVFAGLGDTGVRALTFTTLVVANLGLIFVNRSWTMTTLRGLKVRNAALWWVTGGTLTVLTLLLAFGPPRTLFRFAALSPLQLAVAAGAGVLSVAWFEIWKVFTARRAARAG